MKADEVRTLTVEERESKLKELKEVLFNLRFKHEIGQLDNTSKLRLTRRDIALIKTITKQNQK